MDETTLLIRKLKDTAKRAYKQNIYTYTGFLGMSELDIYYKIKNELSFIHSECFGGNPSCERQIIQFGSSDDYGYEGHYPITLVRITPLTPKFAENLNHRDYLGAIMNLGIERTLIGDIIIKEKTGYVYCMEHISNFLIENLTKIKHTNVKCEVCDNSINETSAELENVDVIAASPRIDAVVAVLTKMSRNAVIELFRTKKIFVNGLCTENNSGQLKEGDILVIRGNGKYIYDGCGNATRKGRIYIRLRKYV